MQASRTTGNEKNTNTRESVEAGCPREKGLLNYLSSDKATKHSSVIIDCREALGNKCPTLISVLHLSCYAPSIQIMYTYTHVTPVESCRSKRGWKKLRPLEPVFPRETNLSNV